ncbi:hypothetical protein [Tsukamurella strandjordii]|uniref:Uncharacterized protein n=1 Tax=Tsukamurella strandjordii TaxID=147577 RepID=A0AA90NDE2_9ACTN|nr:hypothetical protein [Tsukamurella strandjordii]MDP0400487.1 hypothetical protein [Tsukamurella strandjordii]
MSRTVPCPLCGNATPRYSERYDAVCPSCHERAMCSHGQRVSGYNTSFSGGFEGRHADDTVCAQVTGTGLVTVDGRACRMGEAKFGGVYVEPVPRGDPSPTRIESPTIDDR